MRNPNYGQVTAKKAARNARRKTGEPEREDSL